MGGKVDPAFPTPSGYDYKGLTKREWFAGQALAGITARDTSSMTCEELAVVSYKIADAMIKKSEKS